MSGEGPESVPTSADPRSRRPTKKRVLSPASAQAASVDALFAKPDREIRLPPSATSDLARPRRPAPPEIVSNVQGSSAGAGSGEFHVYKASRRREYERLRDMDADLRRQKSQEQFELEKSARDRRDDDKTRKNREKRERLKARKEKGRANPPPARPVASPPLPPASADAADADEPRPDAVAGADAAMPHHVHQTSAAPATGPGLVIHDDD